MPYVLIALVLCAAGAFVYIKFFRKTAAEKKGAEGERKVRKILSGLFPDGKLFNDLMIEVDGKSSQIDHVLVSHKGIFVVETKNYAGRIYGQDEWKEWTQSLAFGKKKYKFYNPVKQNTVHIIRLKEILGIDSDRGFHSVVCFASGDIHKVKSKYTTTLSKLPQRLAYFKDDVLTDDEVANISQKLASIEKHPMVSMKEHKQNIAELKETVAQHICPNCNIPLVIKTSKHGEFYACPNYPKCKFSAKKE